MNQTNADFIENVDDLASMPFPQLRKLASSVYRVNLRRDNTREEIINLITEAKKRKNFAQLATSDNLKPGHARITLLPDQTPGSTQRPVPFTINGDKIWVPRNVPVNIPLRYLYLMQTLIELQMDEDTTEPLNSHNRFRLQPKLAYPFQLHEINSGEEPPRPSDAVRKAQHQPREDFAEMFGYWPSDEELKREMRAGTIRPVPKGKETVASGGDS